MLERASVQSTGLTLHACIVLEIDLELFQSLEELRLDAACVGPVLVVLVLQSRNNLVALHEILVRLQQVRVHVEFVVSHCLRQQQTAFRALVLTDFVSARNPTELLEKLRVSVGNKGVTQTMDDEARALDVLDRLDVLEPLADHVAYQSKWPLPAEPTFFLLWLLRQTAARFHDVNSKPANA